MIAIPITISVLTSVTAGATYASPSLGVLLTIATCLATIVLQSYFMARLVGGLPPGNVECSQQSNYSTNIQPTYPTQ